MKESTCGRIVQQKKPPVESRLIKEYDTSSKFFDIHYDRINELKNKYQTANILSSHNRSPFQDLTVRTNNNSTAHNEVVSTTLFTPRDHSGFYEVNRKSKIKGHNMKQEYVRKVEIVNQGINTKLSSLEEELELLKLERLRKQKLEEMYEAQKKTQNNEVQEVVMSKIKAVEAQELILFKEKQSPIKAVEPIEIIPDVLEQMVEKQITNQVQESQCKLLEEVKQGKIFSHQFRTLIHRIKNQISLDYEFTQLVLTVPRESLTLIKQSISSRHRFADLSFFQVSAMEMDPLQPVPTQPVADISATSQKLYQYYRKIEEHFLVKLHHKFSKQTVACLFEEIGNEEITLGHLISYVNMQTGRQFRNRALVKLLRRMQICTHRIEPSRFFKCLCL